MNRFIPVLERISDQLDVPQPAKSRILIEISTDLEEMYRYYQEQGLNGDQAYQKTIETLDMSESAIKELSMLHLNIIRRWMVNLNVEILSRWERLLLIFIVSIVLIAGLFMTTTQPFLADASIFIGPVYILFLTAIGVSITKIYQLYIRQDHNLKKLDRYMSLLLNLSGAILFFGILGYYLEFILTRSRNFVFGPLYFLLTVESGYDKQSFEMLIDWILRSSSMVVISLLSAIIIALIWYMLYKKITAIEQAEMSILLNNKNSHI